MILFWGPPLPVQPASCMLSEWKYFYSAAFDRKFFENQQPQRHKQVGTFECAILFSRDPFLGRTNIFQDRTRCLSLKHFCIEYRMGAFYIISTSFVSGLLCKNTTDIFRWILRWNSTFQATKYVLAKSWTKLAKSKC